MSKVCTTPKKVRYATKEYALARLAEHDPELRAKLKPYHCQCGAWHLTSIRVMLLRQESGNRRWSVIRRHDGMFVLAIGADRRRLVKLELTPDQAHEIAEALQGGS